MYARLVAALACLAATPCLAQTASPAPAPAPDKSGFSLFNPTPDDAMRAFSTDRPDKSNSPYTVDAGHLQIETDLFNTSIYRSRGVTVRTYELADPVLKVGLTNTTDLEIGFGGYEHSVTTGGGVHGVTDSGFGDITPRLKWNLLGDDSGTTALAIIPYVKIPTAAVGVGNGQVEGGLIATLSFSLPLDITAIVMTELDVLKNGVNNGKHANFVNLVNLSHTIYGDLSGSVELASQISADHTSTSTYTSDFALSYALTPSLQLDAASYIGLNRDAPRLTLYTGVSKRF